MVESKEYPKWIETKNETAKTKDGKPIYERVLVQDAKEEQKVLGTVKKEDTKEPEKKEDAKEPEKKEDAKEPEKKWPK